MKIKHLGLALLVSLSVVVGVPAQAPGNKAPAKSPADVASDAFYKIYNDKDAKLSQERFKQVIDSGIDFLTKYPTSGKANGVIRDVAYFGDSIRDKKLAAYRSAYVTQLKFEVVNARYKAGVTDDGKAALAALEAAAIDFETREAPSRDAVNGLREKLDALTTTPGSGRFLSDREKSYVEILTRGVSPAAGEAHLKKLLTHAEKSVAAMARTEMNIVEVRKAPYELKFTALDGKAVDVAALRGKVVALVFWSGSSEGTKTMLDQVKQAHSFFKKNVEVIGVALDKEADREKVTKFIKEQKINWPVHYDGQEAKTEWIGKLNVTKAPAIVLFDKKGMFVRNNQPANQLEGEFKRLAEAK
ncbi:MAG: redoxin domain-containing protein [Verrucomicrobia bacterium]|nr:redoxin domain-containing protein [Verrucomicrobiota bacterium]